MADVAIETSTYASLPRLAQRGGPFWTSPTVGYVIYVDSSNDLKYRKTGNGGTTWGSAINIRTGTVHSYDCWADWQTAGDAGTKIHIAYVDSGSDDIRYVYLDTNGDSVGGDAQIEACQGNGSMETSTARGSWHVTLTKTRGGNLAVAFRYVDSFVGSFYRFYTSPDGNTWTSKASPWEAAKWDYALLFPGNEADNQDVWATFWDVSANEISLKTYDDSGNSWSGQSISLNMSESSTYLQMDGQVRLSDGHLIFAAWSEVDVATADLKVWDINGAGSITAKADVITDTAEYALVSVFVNQVNDDIYIAYVGGAIWRLDVKALYKKSVDGGANWGGQQAMQANAEADEGWISAGCIKEAWGGKFQPYWFDDDLSDLFTNTDNGIEITVGGVNYPISLSVGLNASSTVVYAVAWDRNVTPGLTAAVTVLKGWGRKITTSPGLTISATVVKLWGRKITTSANLTISTTISRVVAFKRAVSSGLTAAVTLVVTFGRLITTNTALSISTTVSRQLAYARAITANLVVSATIARLWNRTIVASPGLIISATVDRVLEYKRALSSNLTIAVSLLINRGWSIVTNTALTIGVTVSRTLAYVRATAAGLAASVTIIATFVSEVITEYFITVTTNLTASVTISRVLAYARATSVAIGIATIVEYFWKYIKLTLFSRVLGLTLKTRTISLTLQSRSLNLTLKAR